MQSNSGFLDFVSRCAGSPATPGIRIGIIGYIFLSICFPVALSAQQPASATTRPVPQSEEPLLITFALSPERSSPAADTMPDRDFRMYDPARRHDIDWGTIGNLGSAARPLLFENQALRGFSVGVKSFDLYLLRPEQLGFYRNARTFSEASFSQGRNQFETNLNARFARTFSGGASFSLEYRTINNLGQYRYQRDKHNALNLGIWLPLGKRYDGFLIFTRNVIRQQENGGIVSDTVFGDGEFTGPIAAEIRLPREASYTRLDDQSFQLTQHLRLIGKGTTGKRALRATHTIAWNQQKYKFSDQGTGVEGLGDDAAFFEPVFLVDLRGIRHFVQVDRIDNAFTLNTFKTKDKGRPSDLLAVGLTHSYLKVNQEPRKFKVSNLFLTGNLALTPSEKFAFTAQGALGVLDNIGEYQLQGDLTLGLGKAGQFRASLLSQIRPPALLFDQLFVSKRQIWDNDFAKPLENTLSAIYALPFIGLEATARAHVVNNYLYFDQNGVAAQTTTPLQVTQLLVRENLRWGKVHFDNTVALQQPNREDVLRLPKWFTKTSVYFSGKVFKKRMLLNAGVDFRINSDFRPDGYHPLSWQFHLQDSLTQQPYPWIDLFASFKVQAFRGFIRYENCATLWDKTQVFYQTARHPQPFGALRFGIAWRFMDGNQRDEKETPNTPTGIGSNPASRPIGQRG
ncbi:MAG: putative porin [Saprospiraceae bacterium]|nr:putative porin [Saprospiraceae bacterium]